MKHTDSPAVVPELSSGSTQVGLVPLQNAWSYFPNQELNPSPLCCKADSLLLDDQGSPMVHLFTRHSSTHNLPGEMTTGPTREICRNI